MLKFPIRWFIKGPIFNTKKIINGENGLSKKRGLSIFSGKPSEICTNNIFLRKNLRSSVQQNHLLGIGKVLGLQGVV